MDTLEVEALCVRAIDFKDNDKIITLYSTEKGKILVSAKGCKKPKAKLKFAASPFCFGHYTLAQKGNNYSLIGCELYDSFYDIALDPFKYYAGMVILEILDKMGLENEFNLAFFTTSLKALKKICYESQDVKKDLYTYLNEVTLSLGYKCNAISFIEFYNYYLHQLEVKIVSLREFIDLIFPKA